MTRPNFTPTRVIAAALFATAITAALCLWIDWCEFPSHPLNEARLAPAFALRHGINPYPPLGGGPLSTWIYGPVGILVNLPATFATSAAGALQIASLINFTVLILPLVVIFFSSKELRIQWPPVRWLALASGVLLIPRPNLIFQVADHAAIAFGLLSCWWLAKHPRPQGHILSIAAIFCVLAIWSKQIAVFLVAAQLAYLLVAGERVAAAKYLLRIILLGAIAFGFAVLSFGWSNLWLNLVVIPGRLPWADNLAEKFAMRGWPLAVQIGLPIVGLIVLWLRQLMPNRSTESGRFFQLTVFAFLAMLPVGLIAFLRVGGDMNSFHPWAYLLPGCILAWSVADNELPHISVRMLVAVAIAMALRGPDLTLLPCKPMTWHLETAARLASVHPHSIWFPRNPIITFYADGELWHSEDGIETRYLANLGLREPDFRRYLPPNLQAVAYPAAVEHPFSMHLLSEFNQAAKIPFWTVHTRAAIPPAKP